MQIFVKSIDGRTLTLSCQPTDNVEFLKNQICSRVGIAPAEQRISYAGRPLDECEQLSLYGICDLATLSLNVDLLGGKKRKKKNYTTPKKIKHKRKKVKLAVLKYYKVDDNGKITRIRRECPSKECGAGVFMAQHFNRTCCGKCHLTYMFDKPGVEH